MTDTVTCTFSFTYMATPNRWPLHSFEGVFVSESHGILACEREIIFYYFLTGLSSESEMMHDIIVCFSIPHISKVLMFSCLAFHKRGSNKATTHLTYLNKPTYEKTIQGLSHCRYTSDFIRQFFRHKTWLFFRT